MNCGIYTDLVTVMKTDRAGGMSFRTLMRKYGVHRNTVKYLLDRNQL